MISSSDGLEFSSKNDIIGALARGSHDEILVVMRAAAAPKKAPAAKKTSKKTTAKKTSKKTTGKKKRGEKILVVVAKVHAIPQHDEQHAAGGAPLA